MTRRVARPSPDVVDELKAMYERRLTRAEYEAAAAIPLSHQEIEDTLALVDWFTRRYPSVLDRFRYVTRKTAEWSASRRSEP
jgi:hypothetical protein